MEFKIDTKQSYTEITPVTGNFNAKLTDALCQKCEELTQSGSTNYIIDLHNCLAFDIDCADNLLKLHETCYGNEQSLVFTHLQDEVIEGLRNAELDTAINITPTLIEAIDIVNMEILERDLFREE